MAGQEVLEAIRRHLEGTAEVTRRAAEVCADDIARAAELIATSIRRGGKVLICGNGGSAADAEHMAAELLGRLTRDFERPALPAIALPANAPFVTAYANDVGFEHVFARQVQALGAPGDVLICISTSGASQNVVRAAEDARSGKLHVITLTGPGGVLPGLADVSIRVPSQDTQHIQEAHLAIEHIICGLVERRLHGPDAERPGGAAARTASSKERPRGSR
ncbi:MAG: D-sedoheptulose-7-phosphate isomerase [bacterium]